MEAELYLRLVKTSQGQKLYNIARKWSTLMKRQQLRLRQDQIEQAADELRAIKDYMLSSILLSASKNLKKKFELKVEAAKIALKRLNPKGKIKFFNHQTFISANGHFSDIKPLKGLPLKKFHMPYGNKLRNLEVLASMPLEDIHIAKSNIKSLSPLQGMRLKHAYFNDNRIVDLSPLKGMPITKLDLNNNYVKDLSPLKGMTLKYFTIKRNPVSDISVLKGMPLEELVFTFTNINNIDALKGAPVTELYLEKTNLSNIDALRDMKLKVLSLNGAIPQNADISLLKDMPIKHLYLIDYRIKNLDLFKTMPLTRLAISGDIKDMTPITKFKLEVLWLNDYQGNDFSFLKKLPLKVLKLEDTNISDLTILKGTNIEILYLPACDKLTDISIVQELPLRFLFLGRCKNLHDLTPLKNCKRLTQLQIPPNPGNIDFLRTHPTLKQISFSGKYEDKLMPAKEFWKEWDKQQQNKKPK